MKRRWTKRRFTLADNESLLESESYEYREAVALELRCSRKVFVDLAQSSGISPLDNEPLDFDSTSEKQANVESPERVVDVQPRCAVSDLEVETGPDKTVEGEPRGALRAGVET